MSMADVGKGLTPTTTTEGGRQPEEEQRSRQRGTEERGNLLMVSVTRRRAFYERAARELLASGYETVCLSALGNALPVAVQAALSLEDKHAAIVKRVETKDVDFQGSRRRTSGPARAAGMEIELQRHPDFKGTRIIPVHVFFAPASSASVAFPPTSDVTIASVNVGYAEKMWLDNALARSFQEILQGAKHDLGKLSDVHAGLFSRIEESATKATVKFMGEFDPIKEQCGSLSAAFIRRGSLGDGLSGSVFIDVFDEGYYPLSGSNNQAFIHVVVPEPDPSESEFLKGVRKTAENLMDALCDFNGYGRRGSGERRLRRVELVRMGILCGDILPQGVSKAQVAREMLWGLDSNYHFGTAPRIQFIGSDDDMEALRTAWLELRGGDETSLQITEQISRGNARRERTRQAV